MSNLTRQQITGLAFRVAGVLVLTAFLFLYLKPRFSGDVAVSSVALAVGKIAVYWYGLIIAAAIFIAYEFIVRPALARKNINEDQFTTYVLGLVLLGIVGARLGFVLQNVSYYRQHANEIMALWHGGLSIHGALVVAVLWTWFYSRKLKLDMLSVLDVVMPAAAFGLAMGRFGNFFNQELIGQPTNLPWKMYVSPDLRPPALAASEFFHPAFLYEALFDLAILIVLLNLAKRQARPGLVFFGFLGLYSVARFVVEFWRYNESYIVWHLSLAQVVSIVLFIGSAVAFFLIRSRSPKPKPVVLPKLG
jgi:phosphatidylglycerol:prolipoprotein diacylglycerol transferase